jgi:hypothetical protein
MDTGKTKDKQFTGDTTATPIGVTGGRPRSGKSRQRMQRPEAAPDRSRIFLYLLFSLVQRIDLARREVFAGDLDLASIIHAISESTVERWLRDPTWREEYGALSRVVGAAAQRGVNALSISQATGIPRETARRKIKKLVAMGAITQVGRGDYILTPGYLQKVVNPALLERLMADALRFMNESLDQGIFLCADLHE